MSRQRPRQQAVMPLATSGQTAMLAAPLFPFFFDGCSALLPVVKEQTFKKQKEKT
jgi:hypothetical protein